MNATGELLLSGPEFGLLAALGAVEPLVPFAEPPLDEAVAEVVISGLLSRGVLVPDGNTVSINEELRPLLGVTFLPGSATRTAHSGPSGHQSASVLRTGDAAVLHRVDAGGLHQLVAVDAEEALRLQREVLSLETLTADAGTEASITLDGVLDRAAADGASAWSAERLERADPEAELRSRLVMVVEDDEGLWLAASRTGEPLEVGPVDAAAARALLAGVLETSR